MLPQREHFHLWPVHVSWWIASLFASFWELFKSSGISFVSLWISLLLISFVLFHLASLHWSSPKWRWRSMLWPRESSQCAWCSDFWQCRTAPSGINVDQRGSRKNTGQLARRLWEFWDTLRKSLRNRSRRMIHHIRYTLIRLDIYIYTWIKLETWKKNIWNVAAQWLSVLQGFLLELMQRFRRLGRRRGAVEVATHVAPALAVVGVVIQQHDHRAGH